MLRRVFSLVGIVPLGVFVLVHFAAAASALLGPRAFQSSLGSGSRLRLIVEAMLLGLPLCFHALLGARIALESRINVGRYPYSSNWAHALSRISGFGTFAFLLWHVWEMRVKVALGQRAPVDFHTDLAASLSSTGPGGLPYAALGYLLGVAFVCMHLAIGVSGFAASFGLVHSDAQYRRVAVAGGVFGLVLFALGASSVIFFATGWSPLP